MKDKRWFKVLIVGGYVLFFLVALVICIRLTFPTNQVKEYLRGQMAERLGATSVQLEDVSLVGLIPGGVSLENLELTLPPVKVKTTNRNEFIDSAPRTLSVEELTVDGSAFGAMSGNFDFELSGKLQGGEINGGRIQAEKNGPIKVEIEDLSKIALGSEGLFLTLTGLDVIGDLSGKLSLTLPSAERDGRQVLAWDQLSTEVALKIEGAKILQPVIDSAMDRMGFTDVELGTVNIKLGTEGGGSAEPKPAGKRLVIAISELSMKGGDIEVMAAPKAAISIMPGQTLKEATINLQLVVKVNDSFYEKEMKDRKDPTKMMKPNLGLRTMQTMGPLKAHTVEGQFGVSFTGPISKPKVSLGRPRTRIDDSGSGSGRKMNVDQPDADSPPPGEGEEEGPAKRVKPARSGRTEGRSAPIVRSPSGDGAPVPASPTRRPNLLGGPPEPPEEGGMPGGNPLPPPGGSPPPPPVDPAMDPMLNPGADPGSTPE
jgi:type II secretion system protein N